MIICDLCGETKDCLHREIEGKQYDICSECWSPFALKLKGKGRAKNRETVFLPPPRRHSRIADNTPESCRQLNSRSERKALCLLITYSCLLSASDFTV
jgi:ribosome-binding protein aMBF1 (putative translation factor)